MVYGQASAHYAVIGAGMSGLACARLLSDAGAAVTLLEKSRGLGGRLATRRTDSGSFDHGAQYFTVRDQALRTLVQSLEHSGDVSTWAPRSPNRQQEPWYVGIPAMSAMAKAIGRDLNVMLQTRVTRLVREGSKWSLESEEGPVQGAFDAVLVTAPPLQAVALIEAHAPDWASQIGNVEMLPCWTLMLTTGELEMPWDAHTPAEGPIGWWARDDSKPGRGAVPGKARWVIQASAQWSQTHVNDTPQQVGSALLDCFARQIAGVERLPDPEVVAVHRWLYARRGEGQPTLGQSLWNAGSGLGICGDGLTHSRVEHAFLSGQSLARQVLAQPPTHLYGFE